MPQAEFEKDFTSKQSWERVQLQLSGMGLVTGNNNVRTVSTRVPRPDCYFDLGIQILESVDALIALWDGEKARGLGGTEQVVTQARQIGVPRVIMDSKTGQIRIEGNLDVAFAPDEVVTVLNETIKLGSAGCAAQSVTADELQNYLDRMAMTWAGRFRPSLIAIILLYSISAIMATSVLLNLTEGSAWEQWKWVITAIELILVCYALWLLTFMHQNHGQVRYVYCRFAAELVRGFRSSLPLLDPLAPSIIVHDAKWRRLALSAALLVNASRAQMDTLKLRDVYVATRLSDVHLDGQLTHHVKKSFALRRWSNLTVRVSKFSALFAPPFVFLSLLNKLSKFTDHGAWHLDQTLFTWPFVTLAPILMPSFVPITLAIYAILDVGRRSEVRYGLVQRLDAARKQLESLKTESSIRQCVQRCENILLNDLLNWVSAQNSTVVTGKSAM